MTNASATKSKIYNTPAETYDYIYLGHHRYAIGIDQKENDKKIVLNTYLKEEDYLILTKKYLIKSYQKQPMVLITKGLSA